MQERSGKVIIIIILQAGRRAKKILSLPFDYIGKPQSHIYPLNVYLPILQVCKYEEGAALYIQESSVR